MKLTSCLPSQPSFNSCSELVHSRFSVADVENLGISGLEVTEVVRVENRLLFNGYVHTFHIPLLCCCYTPIIVLMISLRLCWHWNLMYL